MGITSSITIIIVHSIPSYLYQVSMSLNGFFNSLWLSAYVPLRYCCRAVLQKPLDRGDIIEVVLVYLCGIPFSKDVGAYALIAQLVLRWL